MPPDLDFIICFLEPLANHFSSFKMDMVSKKPNLSSLGITHGASGFILSLVLVGWGLTIMVSIYLILQGHH